MAHVIRSGAFLQQCWSVHPLCLTVKRVEGERDVVLTCRSCRMVHHATIATITIKAAAGAEPGAFLAPDGNPAGLTPLMACVGTHAPALSLRDMDVFQDALLIRCAECRLQYHMTVALFETHQK